MEVWVFGLAALVILLIVVNIFSLSLKLLWNGVVGMILLWLFNLVGELSVCILKLVLFPLWWRDSLEFPASFSCCFISSWGTKRWHLVNQKMKGYESCAIL